MTTEELLFSLKEAAKKKKNQDNWNPKDFDSVELTQKEINQYLGVVGSHYLKLR